LDVKRVQFRESRLGDIFDGVVTGVTAFGLPDGIPLLVDAAVMARPRIVLGGGSRSWKVIAPSSILLSLPNVEVVDGLANPAPPRDVQPPA
jgi:prolyl-tRNA editing enzyme YbaK/EbsC (Cys-tRNA(Pro) deacylase)